MARRLYLAPIVGTGKFPDPYRSKVADYGVDCRIAGHGAGVDTQPGEMMLTLVDADDFTQITADPEICPIPVRALTTRLVDLTAAQALMVTKLEIKSGLTLADAADLRELVRRIGARRNRDFRPEDL